MIKVLLLNFLAIISVLGFLFLALVLGRKIFKIFRLRLDFLTESLFSIALGLGIFGYLVYFLGLAGFLYPITFYLILFLTILVSQKEIFEVFKIFKAKIKKIDLSFLKNRFYLFLVLIILAFLALNLIAALTPETEFDTLWYHLPLVKKYLFEHKISRYSSTQLETMSAAPRFFEMLYTFCFVFFKTEIMAKLLHFFLGVFGGLALFSTARRFFSQKIAIISLAIFYSSLLFGWLSRTTYVDFGVLFFGFLAILAFLIWREDKKENWLFLIGILTAISVATKLLNLYLFGVLFLGIIFIYFLEKRKFRLGKSLLVFSLGFILILSPWLIDAFVRTGNPLYPIFSIPPDWEFAGERGENFREWFLIYHPKTFWSVIKKIFLLDISPFFALIPLLFLFWRFLNSKIKIILFLVILGFLAWSYLPIYVSRYLIAFVPLFVLLSAISFDLILRKKIISPILSYLFLALILIPLLFLSLRQNRFFLPVVFGIESRHEFLIREVPKKEDDFYDIDSIIAQNIKETDKTLVYGIHNLYYLDCPYLDATAIEEEFQEIDGLDQFLKVLKEHNLTHILTKTYNLTNIISYLAGEEKANIILKDPDFNQHFKLIYNQLYGDCPVYFYQIVY